MVWKGFIKDSIPQYWAKSSVLGYILGRMKESFVSFNNPIIMNHLPKQYHSLQEVLPVVYHGCSPTRSIMSRPSYSLMTLGKGSI